MPHTHACRILVRGRVQGVNFRTFAQRKAQRLGLAGFARNLPDGSSVEVYAQGSEQDLKEFIGQLRVGPPLARVESVDEAWLQPLGEMEAFRVVW